MRMMSRFRGVTSSAPQARRFLTESLAGVGPDLLEELSLVVSELAANAIRHGGTDFTLCIEQDEDAIRIEVEDRGPGHPQIRSPGPAELSGRGLQIVEAFADDWGVVRHPGDAGKTVWVSVVLADGDRSTVEHDQERARSRARPTSAGDRQSPRPPSAGAGASDGPRPVGLATAGGVRLSALAGVA
jgi:anti-sigma regulatory factor (Ser/Thr protein kinase)